MLVGRDHETGVVDALVAQVRLGTGGVLVLSGEPGIGKSALLRYAVHRAGGLLLLRTRGSGSERDLPFAALAQLLRPLLGRLDALPTAQSHAIARALALAGDGDVDLFAVAVATLNLLVVGSEEQPVVVVVDDAHHLDLASAQVLGFVMRRVPADPVLVLVATRAGEPRTRLWEEFPTLPLARLAEADAAALADRVGAGRLSVATRDRVVAVSRGNPLAVAELAGRPAGLARLDPVAPPPVSTTVTASFGGRLEALSSPARLVLLCAAVGGSDLRVVADMCAAAGERLSALEEAETAGLVVLGGDRVEFAHPLVASALYALAEPAQRRRTHALAASVPSQSDPDRRAWHRAAATLGPDAGVALELERAGDRAASRGARSVAASAYDRAAALSPTAAEHDRRVLLAGEAAWLAGENERVDQLLDQLGEPSPGSGRASRAVELRGLAAARGGLLSSARDLLVASADGAPGPAQALLRYAEAVDVCFYLLDGRGALMAADRAEEIMARDPAARDRATAIASIAVGMARTLGGIRDATSIRRGVDILAELTVSAQDADDGLGATSQGTAWEVIGPLFLRESGAGTDLVAIERARARSAVGRLPHLLFHLARDDATTRHWTRAVAGYGEAAALARELGQTTELGAALAGLSWLTARQDRPECEAYAAEALAIADRRGLRIGRSWVEFGLAERDLADGHAAVAAARFGRLDDWLTGLAVGDVDLFPGPELAEALVAAGRGDEAVEVVARYADNARRKGLPWAVARSRRAEGLLVDDERVVEVFEDALAVHARTPDLFEEARTRLVYGERLRRARRRVEARVQLGRALDAFAGLGAPVWEARARRELEATGARARRRGPDAVQELTAREVQVALLLAAGRTTREAAAALFLSPKTVEYHLRHVYAKLAITSRSELTQRMSPAPERDGRR